MGANIPKIQPNAKKGNAANSKPQVYEVKKGDTVYSLAKKYGMSVQEFKELTGIKGDVLTLAQKINTARLENAGKKIQEPKNNSKAAEAQKAPAAKEIAKPAVQTVEKPKVEPVKIEEKKVVVAEEKSIFKRFVDWAFGEDEKVEPKKVPNTDIKKTSDGTLKVVPENKTKVTLGNDKTSTAGQLYKDSFTYGTSDYKKMYEDEIKAAKRIGKSVNLTYNRPEPLLDKNNKITALVEVHNPTGDLKNAPLKGKTIIVNAGHGGYNPKTGVFDGGTHALDSNLKLQEEWVKNKRFTDAIIPELTSRGAKVIFIQGAAGAVMKAKKEHANADLFISIHCDSAEKNKNKRGQVILYRGDDAKAQRLANSVENKVETHEWLSKDLCESSKDARGLGVLNAETKIPSIIIETGFQSNAKDLANIDSRKFHAEFAELLGQGVEQYFNPAKTFSSYKKADVKKNAPASNFDNQIAKQFAAVMEGAKIGGFMEFYSERNKSTPVTNTVVVSKNATSSVSQADKTVEKLMPYIRNTAKETGFSEGFIRYIVKTELGNKTDFKREYDDTVGTKTIGIGHKVDKKDKSRKKALTNDEMFDYLKKDLKEAEGYIIDKMKGKDGASKKENYKKELNFRQKEALVDFVFNRGIGNLERNTDIPKLLKKDKLDHDAIASEFTYSTASGDGKFKCGLTKRRLWEMQRFTGDNLKNSPKTLKAAQELYNAGFNSGKTGEKLTQGQLHGYNQEIYAIFGDLIKYKTP